MSAPTWVYRITDRDERGLELAGWFHDITPARDFWTDRDTDPDDHATYELRSHPVFA